MNRRLFLSTLAVAPLVATTNFQHSDNLYLTYEEFITLKSLKKRLYRLRKYIGFANFNLVSYSNALFYGRNYSSIGRFTKEELALIDRFFFEDQKQYGFFGEKTCTNINNKISKKSVVKIPYTGHYLFKGKPLKDYKKLRDDIGKTLVLTSGVRNVIKQLSLYVNKIYYCGGDMTKASTSLAPPSHSYHTVSDFDVGIKGWGYKNFTVSFATTDEFYEMQKLDYIGMRYSKNNQDGVRFEPWHIEII